MSVIETSQQLIEASAKIETEFRALFNAMADKYGDKVGTVNAPKFDDNIPTADAEKLATLNLVRIRTRLALEAQYETEKTFKSLAEKYNIVSNTIPSEILTPDEYNSLNRSFANRTDAFTRLNKVRVYSDALSTPKA